MLMSHLLHCVLQLPWHSTALYQHHILVAPMTALTSRVCVLVKINDLENSYCTLFIQFESVRYEKL